MPSATRTRLCYFRLLALLMLFVGLASGCQSSRPSFSFQPAPGRVQPLLTTPAASHKDSAAALAPAGLARAHEVGKQLTRAQGRAQQQIKLAVKPTENTVIAHNTVRQPAAIHRRARLQRPHPTAEAGLGTTVLGILGLVALPIALIGLLLSGGGLVWGIVAGAAALAVLVAYLDPFG